MIIIALYRSPSGVTCEYFIHLTDILEQLVQKDQYIILVGVLNINIQEEGCGNKKFLVFTDAYNLTVTINIPT
jgi:hypothetical protein